MLRNQSSTFNHFTHRARSGEMSAFPTSSHPHNRSPLAAPLLGADTTRLRVGFTRLRELRTGTDRETENGRRGLHVRGRSSARAAADRSPARTEGARPTLRRARTRLDPRDRCLSFGAARLSQEPLPEAGRVPPLALGRRFSQPGSAPPRRRRTARFPLRIPRAEFPVPAAPPAPRCHWSVRRGGRAVGAGAFRAVVARCLRHHRARPGWPRHGWRRRCPAPCACCASTAPGRPRPGWGWRWRRAGKWWTSARPSPRCPAPCGPSWRAASCRLPAGGGAGSLGWWLGPGDGAGELADHEGLRGHLDVLLQAAVAVLQPHADHLLGVVDGHQQPHSRGALGFSSLPCLCVMLL